ncbi:Hpt domain-containing protein [Spongiibacter sp. KMU-158]|uniref:Hpt domain-containing protein n=1 Tax=Spongiibacter pelagi TaxID=2760804 RepID=A0A927C391_9GAMM|nr:Hpt domain-containing protein [Spongiibacter pelagi]MBD2859017.1 Hpt domain-containing protein [Spongiibacter pelagi]
MIENSSAMTGEMLDRDLLSELKMIMPDQLDELVARFELDGTQRLEQMQTAIVQQQGEPLRQAAHTFKGGAGSLGALGLASQLKLMEGCGRESDFSAAQGLFSEINTHFSIVLQALRVWSKEA